MDPTEIKIILDLNWRRIAPALVKLSGGPDKFLFFHPNLLGRLSRKAERETSTTPGAPYSVTIDIVSDVTDLDRQAGNAQGRASLDRFRARYGMINLSRLRREVDSNLIAFATRPT
jgi:hypothetical protein